MAKKLVTSADDALSNLGDKTSLAESLIKDVNKKLGKEKAFVLGEQEAPTDITNLIHTGSTILDTILTNGKWETGGWPVRRLIEISGNTSAGKSLLANHALIETQRMGGIPILFDEENTTDIGLLVKMGLKVGKDAENAGLHKLVYLSAGSVEDVFDSMESLVKKVRELGSRSLITIVWDSIASTPSKEELQGSYDQEGYGTSKARAISKAMRKVTQFIGNEDVLMIFTNQLRQNIGKFGFGDTWVSPGGQAVPFHASIRVRLTRVSDIKRGDDVVGITVQAHIRKNKIAPPARKCTFDIYFDKGIDDESSWMENLVTRGVIKRPTKMKYEIDLPSGKTEFKSSEWKSIVVSNREHLRNLVITANTIDYSNLSPNFDELVEAAKNDEVAETGESL